MKIANQVIALLLLGMYFSAQAQDWQFGRQYRNPVATVSITATTPNGERPATLTIGRTTGQRGNLFFELEVYNWEAIKDFDFSEFEGPDAPFGKQRLARITARSSVGEIAIEATGAGWISERYGFIFSVAGILPGTKRKLLKIMQGGNLRYSFAVRGLKNRMRAIAGSCSSAGVQKAIQKVVEQER